MELEQLIVSLILKINTIFLHTDYKLAAVIFHKVLQILSTAQRYYPRNFGNNIAIFNCFYFYGDFKSENQELINFMNLKELADYVACMTTRYYFYRHWPAVVCEIYDEQNRELRCKEIKAFKKICLFFQDCNEYFQNSFRQAIHLRLCMDPKVHLYYDIVMVQVSEIKLIMLIDRQDVEKYKKAKARLAKENPHLKRMLYNKCTVCTKKT